jgi:hypothetical protein
MNQTWMYKSGCISFSLDLLTSERAEANVRMINAVRTVTIAMEMVARPVLARIGSISGGEDSAVFELPSLAPRFYSNIEHQKDISDVALDCDLLCLQSDGSSFQIPRAMTVWISREQLDDASPSAALQLQISLDVDIYAAVDDDVRDNRHLAALNGVRFNSFLATLVRTLPAQVTDVDACYHAPGLVTATGFALPNM